jgi:Concanavalin A-like lectin/glucanases superfamily
MADFKFSCPRCGKTIQCDTGYCGSQINCPACQQPISVPQTSDSPATPPMQTGNASAAHSSNSANAKILFVAATIVILLAVLAVATWFFISNKLPRGVPRNGLAAFWKANGSINDMVGDNKVILQNGARFIDGSVELKNSEGMRSSRGSSKFPPPAYDGGACLQVQDSSALTLGDGDFTIELWANFNSVPVFDIGHAQGGVFISKDEGPFNVNKWWFALGGGVLDFHINDPQLGPVFLVQAPFRPRLKQWYHFAITRGQNVFTIYVNGVPVGSETSDRAIPNVNAPLKIGEAEGYYFNGRLKDIGIYHRALSAAEIKGIFDAGAHR